MKNISIWEVKQFMFAFMFFLFFFFKENKLRFHYISDERGCSYCGGLGHRITECPKLEAIQNKQASNIGRRDYLASNAADY